MQLDEVREYCRRRGWKVEGEYVDEGISGSKEHRPALDRLLSDCRKRLADAVVVYRYDRFARSLRQLVNALDEFRALGIDFVSLHEGVDTSTPNGRLVFGIFASIAEFERELIRDRVRSGLAAARYDRKTLRQWSAKGGIARRERHSSKELRAFARHAGRRPYKLTGKTLKRLREMLAAGKPHAEISKRLGVSARTIRRFKARL